MLPNVSDPTVDFGLPYSNYDTQGVINPETEVDASYFENQCVDVSALTHVCPRAIIYLTWVATVPIISVYDSVWGDDPTIWPIATNLAGSGNVKFTWDPAGYYDLNPTVARRVKRAPTIRMATAHPTVAGMCDVSWTSNTVSVHIYDHTHTEQYNNFCLMVW